MVPDYMKDSCLGSLEQLLPYSYLGCWTIVIFHLSMSEIGGGCWFITLLRPSRFLAVATVDWCNEFYGSFTEGVLAIVGMR